MEELDLRLWLYAVDVTRTQSQEMAEAKVCPLTLIKSCSNNCEVPLHFFKGMNESRTRTIPYVCRSTFLDSMYTFHSFVLIQSEDLFYYIIFIDVNLNN